MQKDTKVCIIGCGSSGMVAAKVLFQNKIPFDCFEAGSEIGGNWKYMNDNGMSSAYESLHINTSKQMMAYSDFPMPDHYPDYTDHRQIFQYFNDYVDHFGFRDRITFNTKVEHIEKLGDRRYKVTTDKFGEREYTDVVVANGHHWSPKYPNFPGHFSGETLHTHYYKIFKPFIDKRVLIIGMGNSAVDIACELSTVAKKVTVSTRSGAYILPKYMFGMPTDHLTKPPLAFMPLWFQRLALRISLTLSVGNQKKYGMPVPDRPLLREHPTVSGEILEKIGHGKIDVKPNVAQLDGKDVYFTDNTHAEYDTIIYATGYKIDFPFFDSDFFIAENNEMPLYEYTVDIDHPGLYFFGFIQPIGSVMPLVEMQAEWLASLLTGKKQLPAKDKMIAWYEQNRKRMRKRYGDSGRHTLEVDFFPYLKRLKKLAGV